MTTHLAIPEPKITVTRLGLSASNPPLSEEEIRRGLNKWGLQPGYVLFVGILEPRKNVKSLLAFFSRLSLAFQKAHPLVLAGRGRVVV